MSTTTTTFAAILENAVAAAITDAEARGYERGYERGVEAGRAEHPRRPDLVDALGKVAAALDALDTSPEAILVDLAVDTSGLDTIDVPSDGDSLSEVAEWVGEHGGATLVAEDDLVDAHVDDRRACAALAALTREVEAARAALREIVASL